MMSQWQKWLTQWALFLHYSRTPNQSRLLVASNQEEPSCCHLSESRPKGKAKVHLFCHSAEISNNEVQFLYSLSSDKINSPFGSYSLSLVFALDFSVQHTAHGPGTRSFHSTAPWLSLAEVLVFSKWPRTSGAWGCHGPGCWPHSAFLTSLSFPHTLPSLGFLCPAAHTPECVVWQVIFCRDWSRSILVGSAGLLKRLHWWLLPPQESSRLYSQSVSDRYCWFRALQLHLLRWL